MDESYVIGIGGGSGAGKTTVAEDIEKATGEVITIISLDNYYRDQTHKPMEERRDTNYDHPDAFEWRLIREQLDQLTSGQAIDMPQYDFEIHNRTDETERVEPNGVVVVEGIFALYDEVVDRYDLPLYVYTDSDVRLKRRIERDMDERGRTLDGVLDQWFSTVKPMHHEFVEPTERNADMVIREGAKDNVVEVLSGGIKQYLDG